MSDAIFSSPNRCRASEITKNGGDEKTKKIRFVHAYSCMNERTNERTNYFFGFIFISVHKNMDNYEKIALVLMVFFSSHEKIVVARKSSKTAFPIFRCLRIYAGMGKTLAGVKNRIRHERFSLCPMHFFPARTDAVQARSRKINDDDGEKKSFRAYSCMNE